MGQLLKNGNLRCPSAAVSQPPLAERPQLLTLGPCPIRSSRLTIFIGQRAATGAPGSQPPPPRPLTQNGSICLTRKKLAQATVVATASLAPRPAPQGHPKGLRNERKWEKMVGELKNCSPERVIPCRLSAIGQNCSPMAPIPPLWYNGLRQIHSWRTHNARPL